MSSQPTLAGYTNFLYNIAGIPVLALPTASQMIPWSYSAAMMEVNPVLASICSPAVAPVQTSAYAEAVYNLGADLLFNFTQDQPGYTYFKDARKGWGILGFTAGVVQSTSDSGTSTSLAVPEALSNLSISQLQNTKTPFGQRYLGLAQRTGTDWGLT